jgi:hypothetical protein
LSEGGGGATDAAHPGDPDGERGASSVPQPGGCTSRRGVLAERDNPDPGPQDCRTEQRVLWRVSNSGNWEGAGQRREGNPGVEAGGHDFTRSAGVGFRRGLGGALPQLSRSSTTGENASGSASKCRNSACFERRPALERRIETCRQRRCFGRGVGGEMTCAAGRRRSRHPRP